MSYGRHIENKFLAICAACCPLTDRQPMTVASAFPVNVHSCLVVHSSCLLISTFIHHSYMFSIMWTSYNLWSMKYPHCTVWSSQKNPLPWGYLNFFSFLPARRYASAGNRDRNVSVCLSVCPSRAGIVSKRRKLASWFLHLLVAPRL